MSDKKQTPVEMTANTVGRDLLQAELDKAYEAGRTAASQGDPKDAAPVADHRLVARWTQGWTDWHDENDDPSASTGDGGAAAGDDEDPLLAEATKLVVKERRASISHLQRHLRIGYNRAARLIEALEQAGVVSAPDAEGTRKVLRSSDEETTA